MDTVESRKSKKKIAAKIYYQHFNKDFLPMILASNPNVLCMYDYLQFIILCQF